MLLPGLLLLLTVLRLVFLAVLLHGLLFCNDIYKHQLMWNLVIV